MLPKIRHLIALLMIGTSAFAGDPPNGVADALALQETLRQGREYLSRGETAKAVDLLEKQITKIHGDPAYLMTLKEAYQTYVKELQLANKSETLEVYRKRLAVLEKGTLATPPKREIARGARPDDEQQQPKAPAAKSTSLTDAEKAFVDKRYAEARALFAKADGLTAANQSQYAYCVLHSVVERHNAGSTPSNELQREVRSALAMAPQDSQLAKFGNQLLQQLGESDAPTPGGAIRHGDAGNGWKKAESANFRLLHAQEKSYAEQFLKAAEQHRETAFTKWAGSVGGKWEPLCEVVLHVNGASYAQTTGQNATTPGHSTIKMPGGKVTSRRIDVRADNQDLAAITLPHEITHVVLADLFPDGSLPRWADEGMAVLSEPRSQVERYLKTMMRLRSPSEKKLIPLSKILTRNEYPDSANVTVFYVESVSVVEFLVNQKGTIELVKFLKDAKGDLEGALQRHYGWNSVAQLEEAWRRATFTEIDQAMGVAGR